MCFPEYDIPKNVLETDFSDAEIVRIVEQARGDLKKRWPAVAQSLSKISAIDGNFQNAVSSLISDAVSENFVEENALVIVEKIYDYLNKVEKNIKHSSDYATIGGQLANLRQLRECLDSFLAWNLFSLTKYHEAMDRIGLEPAVIFEYYAKSCEIVVQKNFVERVDQKNSLEKAREFFLSIAKWLKSGLRECPSEIEKNQKFQKYEDLIKLLKKTVRRGWL